VTRAQAKAWYEDRFIMEFGTDENERLNNLKFTKRAFG